MNPSNTQHASSTEEVILLEKSKRIVSLILGLIFTLNGTLTLLNSNFTDRLYNAVLGGILLTVGVLHLIYYTLAWSIRSKYSAKVRLTDQFVEIKESFLKNSRKIDWKDIRHITLGHTKVEFEITDSKEVLLLRDDLDKLDLIKAKIEALALTKGLPLTSKS